MATLQIEVTELEKQQLGALAADTGKREDELIRLALAAILVRRVVADTASPTSIDKEGLVELRAVRGMWADHSDLPEDLHAWRKAQERSVNGWH